MRKFSKINENISYSKSILKKKGIDKNSPEYQDYLKIRNICGNNNGYVGILTRIRFVDNIEDMDEIESIFDILKNSKINIGKLTKMSYDEILDIFYDEMSGDNDKNKDVELFYKDSQYSYFKVHTYKGILKIGSPTWCLKTKNHWDNYQAKYPEQWVVIDNRYVKNIVSADNNYLDNYKSSKGWIRYGVSVSMDMVGNTVSYAAFTDNNNVVKHGNSYTFFGIVLTILNLSRGIKKSYYQHMSGCEPVPGSLSSLKVIDKEKICRGFGIPENSFNKIDEVYILCSKTYSSSCYFLLISPTNVKVFYPTKKGSSDLNFADISSKESKDILENYAMRSSETLFSGIQLSKGKITEDDLKYNNKYVAKIGKWLIFDINNRYYQVVNTEVVSYEIPIFTTVQKWFNMVNPMYFYVRKQTYESVSTGKGSKLYTKEVISYLKNINNDGGKVGGFLNFFKRKS